MTVQEILNEIENKSSRVGIIGLGYVGLPLLWRFHEVGFEVLGFDIDERKIKAFEEGNAYIKHFGSDRMSQLSGSDRCEATKDFSRVKEADFLLLCVPTPLDEHREPDMSYVSSTVESIAPHLREGQLVILESTTYPGTTEELITPICEKHSGMRAGSDFYVAYSPEREDPGNPDFSTQTIPKVVGADSEEARSIAVALYSQVIDEVVPVSNTRTAEAVKLLENIFRSVNIALVNEMKMVLQRMDIDVHEVIEAAATKPFGFMKFTPGPGLGGHCIPIDPFYLTWKAREFDINTRFIELAGDVNTNMPNYVVQRTIEALNEKEKSLKGSKVLCIGLAYKPNVDDMRESPSFPIMDLLTKYGADVSYYDPYIPVITPTREHAEWTGQKSVEWTDETIRSFDAALIITDHSDIDYATLPKWCNCIIDTRNAMQHIDADNARIWKA